MKNVHKYLFIILTALFLQSCIANKPATKKKSTTAASTSNTPTTPTFTSDEALYWFTSAKVNGTVTVNQNSQSIIYLRGSNVHSFLLSTDSTTNLPYYQNQKSFCLVANYGASYKQLRLRVVPIFISNYSTKTIERLYRVDVPSRAENVATCGSASIDGVAGAAAAYSLPEICPSCLGTTQLTSASLKLFQSGANLGIMSQIPTTKITFSSIALKVDLQSNSTSDGNSCTNSSCEAKGFDCCIQGQCVKDASEKSSAKDDMTAYNQAMSEYAVNPLSFLNWPNIFNICTNITHNPPTTTDPTAPTPLSTAELRVAAYLDDYKCIDQVQNSSGTLTSLCKPGGAISDYDATKRKLAIACGCPSTYDADTMAIKCPSWGVRPLYRSSVESIANIVDFYCYAPVPENPIGPITNLNVNVSSRTAPHRFYEKTTGIAHDSLTGKPSTVVQEGDDFYYLDEANKSSPVNGSYNVNSILGRMNVALSQTQPAKMVAIELGKTYILSATSGYFTPCSTCAKDSWFQNFTAHPVSTNGVGLRASGFTTSRDTYSANTTLGNYEDTHFGRACYLPVTMIPLSHKKETNLITQRKNRLTTQSAFYINGYQKDWYGFNKGALIGSFDGVSWFAVGSGRRVTATTTKLYLAINGSFLDLADRTDTVVNIIPDISASVAADYDFDPALTISDVRQNTAGSCQQYHQCSTDTDCVAQLGWEYTCADVSQNRSRWPLFDTNANEIAGQEKVGSIFEILSGTTTIGGSAKRCVYRGAGAPCVRDFTALDGKFNQKNLTCAPNFYCAALTTNRFNDELVRSPNEMDNIFFGMDTNVLGRPLKYVTAVKTLPTESITNIRNNGAADALGLTSAEVDDMGICRPGKSLSTISVTAHSNPDSAKRTDYINQIASCDSTTTGANRTFSCPAFGDDMDYLPHDSISPYHGTVKIMQNSCGGEAKHTTTLISAFKNIEGGSLALLTNITTPMFAADACLRRAGSVCHTDLDCGPNKLHEDAAGSLGLSYFGGTEAEQNYWKESLVCGQGSPVPTTGSAHYSTYKLSENRCCREIGKDFTMFTTGPATLIPENGLANVNLSTKKFSALNPAAPNRYSRYTISPTALADENNIPLVNTNTTPLANQWKVINETGSLTCCGGGWVRKFADGTHDWKVKNRLSLETSNFSCLNFRSPLVSSTFNSFGDSSLDKVVQSTYQREYEYFCKSPGQNGCMQILFRDISGYTVQPPLFYDPAAVTNLPADNDMISYPSYTDDPPYPAAAADQYKVSPDSGYTRLDTMPVGDLESGSYTFRMNSDVPYQPFAYTFNHSPPYDLYIFPDGSKRSLPFMVDKLTDYGLHIYLPAYIPYFSGKSGAPTPCGASGLVTVAGGAIQPCLPTVKSIYVKYQFEDNHVEVVNITNLKAADNTACEAVASYNLGSGQPVDRITRAAAPDHESWCVSASTETQNRPMLSVKAYTGAGRAWKLASVIIDFKPMELNRTGLNTTVTTTPGNPYYYLTKLAKLELIGIPQITYEPLYCSSNNDSLVPGIFNSSIKTRSDFAGASFINGAYNNNQNYDDEGITSPLDTVGNPQNRITFQDKLAHAAVFSAKDFACCTPVGKTTTSAAKCCSGAAATANGVMTCKIPTGTDLNVYFNKFVSSEGVGEDQPGGGLVVTGTDDEIDFNQYTGEPKMRTSTYLKLEELGKAYCLNGVVGNGGSFGQFPPEPYSGYTTPTGASAIEYPISIVDSIIDSEAGSNNVGKLPFDSGYRWDHHYYCK